MLWCLVRAYLFSTKTLDNEGSYGADADAKIFLKQVRQVLSNLSWNPKISMSSQLVVAQSAVAVVKFRYVPRPFSLLQSNIKVAVKHSARGR